MLFVSFAVKAKGRFWEWDTTKTTDWSDMNCAYRETCSVHYIFWIAGEEQCVTETFERPKKNSGLIKAAQLALLL